jgi:hypoxanthine-DNA glycosylase
MTADRKTGFAPVFDNESRVLILGSFPSVKSRQIEFYYGNKQNRFWGMLCGYFGEAIPETTEGKKAFLARHKVSLWDKVVACEIEGSADASVKNAEVANLNGIFNEAPIEKILLNGTLAFELFMKKYSNIGIDYKKMPSTSPANPRYQKEVWTQELDKVFKSKKV